MSLFRTLSLSTVLTAVLAGCQTPPDHAAHHRGGMGPGGAGDRMMSDRMAMMDTQMKSMREMHERVARARTPEERQALMAEHMKMMQDGMENMQSMMKSMMERMPGPPAGR